MGSGFWAIQFIDLTSEAHTDGLRDSEFLHRDAIHDIGAFHGAFGVGHDDELALVDEAIENLEEAPDDEIRQESKPTQREPAELCPAILTTSASVRFYFAAFSVSPECIGSVAQQAAAWSGW